MQWWHYGKSTQTQDGSTWQHFGIWCINLFCVLSPSTNAHLCDRLWRLYDQPCYQEKKLKEKRKIATIIFHVHVLGNLCTYVQDKKFLWSNLLLGGLLPYNTSGTIRDYMGSFAFMPSKPKKLGCGVGMSADFGHTGTGQLTGCSVILTGMLSHGWRDHCS